ncbi:MAG: hypothetical protein U0167_01345 [bacterium]
MTVRFRHGATAAALGAFALLFAGCPLKFQDAPKSNSPPFTFFDSAPADTSFKNEVAFLWLSTDLDSDVVAYQFQLVETDSSYYFSGGVSGRVLRSINPPLESDDQVALDNLWSPRSLNNFQSFPDLEDGWYEMRARGIDDKGLPSQEPARKRFYVFFDDVPPVAIVVDPIPGTSTPACGRIPQTRSWTFWINASDESRHSTTPRTRLQYSYQLRGRSSVTCTTHLTDSFTDWRFFPSGNDPIQIGTTPPTQYSDLDDAECGWDFTLRVRDPAGILATTVCCISKATGCSQ